jgi:hypothetical protein
MIINPNDDVNKFRNLYKATFLTKGKNPNIFDDGTMTDEKPITNVNFGVSNSDMNVEDKGALPKSSGIITQAGNTADAIKQAESIATALYGDKTGSEPDWGVASLLYFSKLAEESSKPGATFAGSMGSAFTTPAAYLMEKEKQAQAKDTKRASLVAGLVPSLLKDTSKKPEFYTLSKNVQGLGVKGDVVPLTAKNFNSLDVNVQKLLRPYKEDTSLGTSKPFTNISDKPIVIGNTTVKPNETHRFFEKDFKGVDSKTLGFLKEVKDEDKIKAPSTYVINDLSAIKNQLQLPELNPKTNKKWKQGDTIDLSPDKANKLPIGSFSIKQEFKIYEDEYGDKRYENGPNAGEKVSDVLNAKNIAKNKNIDTDSEESDGTGSTEFKLKKLNKVEMGYVKSYRAEIEKLTKDFRGIQSGYQKIKKFYENKSSIGDYSLAVGYAKVIDPGTAAREGEVNAIANSGALSESIKKQLINAIVGGGKLPEKVRAGIFNNSARIFNEERNKAVDIMNNFKKMLASDLQDKNQGARLEFFTIDDEHTNFIDLANIVEPDVTFNPNKIDVYSVTELTQFLGNEDTTNNQIDIIRKKLLEIKNQQKKNKKAGIN